MTESKRKKTIDVIEIAGTSSGGSNYTGRILTVAATGVDIVHVIIGEGDHQDRVIANIQRDIANLHASCICKFEVRLLKQL